MLEFTRSEGRRNIMSAVIGNLVITSNYLVEDMLWEGDFTEITKSGVIAFCVIGYEIDNINELIEHFLKSFATKYRICCIYRQMHGPSGHPPTNCMTNASQYLSNNRMHKDYEMGSHYKMSYICSSASAVSRVVA